MKGILYFSIKIVIRTALFCYFKKIQIVGEEKVPSQKPLLFLPNHQNALMDPLIIAAFGKEKPYFLTRSDVFANTFLNTFFKLLRMLPIYRIRDGRETLVKNRAIFERCVQLLHDNETILMFAEANHNLQRRVRPLSKGFTRILFGAMQKTPPLDIRLVPIGINYVNAAGFPDSVAFYYGEDIRLTDLYNAKDLSSSSIRVKEQVFVQLKQLTTHIEDEKNYEAIAAQLDVMKVDYLNPAEINRLIQNLSLTNNTIKLKKSPDWHLKIWDVIFKILNLPAILIWKLLVEPKVHEEEFKSTYRFIFSLIIYPIFYTTVFVIIALMTNMWVALSTTLTLVFFNLLYVKFR